MVEKTKSFVFGAGKIILAISIVLWFLGSFGFSEDFKNADAIVSQRIENEGLNDYSENFIKKNIESYTNSLAETLPKPQQNDSITTFHNTLVERAKAQEIASYKLENSLIGTFRQRNRTLGKTLGLRLENWYCHFNFFCCKRGFCGYPSDNLQCRER